MTKSFLIFLFLLFVISLSFFLLIFAYLPFGIIFILASLAQFFFQQRLVRIVAWTFQIIIFILLVLLAMINILHDPMRRTIIYACLIFCLMIGTFITQTIWQAKKKK